MIPEVLTLDPGLATVVAAALVLIGGAAGWTVRWRASRQQHQSIRTEVQADRADDRGWETARWAALLVVDRANPSGRLMGIAQLEDLAAQWGPDPRLRRFIRTALETAIDPQDTADQLDAPDSTQ